MRYKKLVDYYHSHDMLIYIIQNYIIIMRYNIYKIVNKR